jgi:hypothetical protein
MSRFAFTGNTRIVCRGSSFFRGVSRHIVEDFVYLAIVSLPRLTQAVED